RTLGDVRGHAVEEIKVFLFLRKQTEHRVLLKLGITALCWEGGKYNLSQAGGEILDEQIGQFGPVTINQDGGFPAPSRRRNRSLLRQSAAPRSGIMLA